MKEIHKLKPERSAAGRHLEYGKKETKRQLAKDFNCCCGYCGDAHYYTGGVNSFHIDHFAPKSKFPDDCNQYDNLVYSCPYCNISKSDKWVGATISENIVDGVGFVDPCSLEYSEHLGRNEDGSIIYKTSIGKYMYNELKLYLERHKILYQLEELQSKILKIQNKIEENRNTSKNINRLQKMEKILCQAYFFYNTKFREHLDSVLQ